MGLAIGKCLLIVVFCFSFPNSISSFLTDLEYGHAEGVYTQRKLFQVQKPCPVDMEHQNYTIITSQCKAPNFTAPLCCSAFLLFACPLAPELNDLSNNCAEIMFSYIRRIGQYPDGLFSSLCRGGKDGLQCPSPPPPEMLRHSGAPSRTEAAVIMAIPVLVFLFA